MNWFKRFFSSEKQHTQSASSTGLGTVSWGERDYRNFAKEAYVTNFVGYRCVDIIAQAVSSVPWAVFKESEKSRIEQPNHELMRILHRANPDQGFSSFQLAVTSYLGIAGNSYIEKLSPDGGPNKGVPFELHTHQPDQIKPILTEQTQELLGHALIKNGIEIKRWMIDPITGQSDLLHIKKFHPLSDIEGLSPVEPAARSIDTSNEALTWNKKLLQNDARPGMVVIADSALADTQFLRLKEQLNEKYAGAQNAGKTLLLEGAIKDVKEFGFSPKDMDFLEGNWDLVRQICATFGVPPQLLGVPGDSTFANFEQARLFLWENTIFFYLGLIKDEYNNWFFPDSDDVFVDYDLDEVPALAPRRQEKRDAIEKSTFMTIDEKREAMGMEKTPGGDVLLVQASMIPLDMVGVDEEEIDDSEAENNDNDK